MALFLLALSLYLCTIFVAVGAVAPGDEELLCANLRAGGVAPIPATVCQHEGADGLLELSKPSPSPLWSCVGPGGQ